MSTRRTVAALACASALLAGCTASPIDAQPGTPASTTTAEAVPPELGTSASPAPSASPATPVPSLREVRDELLEATDLDIGIFGDSTGDEMSEWPALWATEMSTDQTVTLNRWLSGQRQYETRELSTTGPTRTIWNCSVSGWKPANFYDHVADCLPEVPDLVVLSLGHNNNSDPSQALPQLEELIGLIRARAGADVPIVITMQNPVTTPERQPAADQVTANITEWAIAHDYPIIDAYHAFIDAPQGVPALLKPDGLHPSEAGSRVWADAVVETLTPWRA